MSHTQDRIDAASLERIIPDEIRADETTGSETLRLHIERYQFAMRHVVRGNVLDIACGVGYGTALLAEAPQVAQAIGVDISHAAVEYAAGRYGSKRVAYEHADALQFSPGRQFENIVSLETMEHVDDPVALFGHLVSLLAPGGRFISSVPTTPSVDANPHHKSNFSVKSFLSMGKRFQLTYVASLGQVQPFNPIAVAMRREARTAKLRTNLGLFYLQNPSHFLARVWSILRNGFANKYITVVWEKQIAVKINSAV
jgi:SAM-dependent methyltransferase